MIKSKTKRRIISLLTVISLCSAIGFTNPMKAQASGSIGGSNNSGVGGGGASSSVTTGNFNLWHTAGYRIYFAPEAFDSNGNYASDYVSKLNAYQSLALYELYTYGGYNDDGYLGKTIYDSNGAGGFSDSTILRLDGSMDFSEIFGNLGFKGSLSKIDYNTELQDTGANSFESLKTFTNQIGNVTLKRIRDNYIAYLHSILPASDSRWSDLDALASQNVKNLMLVIEPVLISGKNGGQTEAYAISYQDYFNQSNRAISSGDYDNGNKIRKFTNKLGGVWTEFTYNNIKYNDANRKLGFITYHSFNTKPSTIDTAYGIGVNIQLQYGGKANIKENGTKDTGVSTAFSISETPMQKYVDSDNKEQTVTSISSLGSDTFKNVFKGGNFDNLKDSPINATNYSTTALRISGGEFNPDIWDATGDSGASYKNNFDNSLKKIVAPDMQDHIENDSDYVASVIGNMNYSQINSISTGAVLLDSVAQFDLNVKEGTGNNYGFARPYGTDSVNSDTNANGVQNHMQGYLSNIQAKTVASQIEKDTEYKIGQVYNVNFKNADNSGVLNGTQTQLKGAFANTGIDLSYGNNISVIKCDYDNFTQTSEDITKDYLTKVQGANLMSSKINIAYTPNNPDSFEVKSGNVSTAISFLVPKQYVDNYVCATSLHGYTDLIEKGKVGYKTSGETTSKTYNHLIQQSADIDLNKSEFPSLNSENRSNTYMITWRNDDTIPDKYNLKYNDRETRANNLANAICNNIASEDGIGADKYIGNNAEGTLRDIFRQVTGIDADVIKLGSDEINTTASLGAYTNANGEIVGTSSLIVTVDKCDIPIVSYDILESNWLNMIVPSFAGQYSTSSSVMFVKNADFGEYKVGQDLTGDIYNFKGIDMFGYNNRVGLFRKPTEDTTFNSVTYPSFRYNVARGMWDNPDIVCSYRGIPVGTDGTIYRDYISNTLGLGIGVKPIQDVSGDGAIYKSDITKYDEHTFSILSNGKKVFDKLFYKGKIYCTDARYKITHFMEQYFAKDTPTSEMDNPNKPIESTDGSGLFVTTDESTNKLTMYPEIPKIMQMPEGSSVVTYQGGGNGDGGIYTMGNTPRTFKPTSVRLLKITTEGDSAFEGELKSDTIASASNAMDMANEIRNANGYTMDLPVIYSGGNVNLSIKNNIKVKVASYSMDIADKIQGVDIKNSFSPANMNYKSNSDHDNYVKSIKDNLKFDVSLQQYTEANPRTIEGTTVGETLKDFKVSQNESKIIPMTAENKQFTLKFKNGKITDESKAEIIADMVNTMGITENQAKKYFNEGEFESQLSKALITDTDNLYDEETTSIVLNKYVSTIEIGDMLVSDKVDINLGTDGANNVNDLYSKGYIGKWIMSLSLGNDIKLSNGTKANLGNTFKIYNDECIYGADFIIPNASVTDMRK